MISLVFILFKLDWYVVLKVFLKFLNIDLLEFVFKKNFINFILN